MIHFIADTHFGHAAIIKSVGRPFESVEQMDDAMISNWNRVVMPADTVYHLGDFSLANRACVSEYISRLNGKIFLVRGHHDLRNLPVEWSGDYREIKVQDVLFVLCHYPLLDWYGRPAGAIMLHGHMHGAAPCVVSPNRLDMSVEAVNYTPVSVVDILQTRSRINAG